MKRLRWFLVAMLAAAILTGCVDKKTSSTDKTPPPAVEVAPSPTTAVVLPDVQSNDSAGLQVSPLVTPANALSPLSTPAATVTP